MKKIFKVWTGLLASVAALGCMQFLSGCSGEVGYEYCDEDGGYFIASVTGSYGGLNGELIIPETYDDGTHTAPVKKIAKEGFRGTSISKVSIPASVEEIGDAAFANCQYLRAVEFAEGSQIAAIPQGAFGFCGALTDINIPDTVETIGVLAFYSCVAMRGIDLPESLKVISDEAFEDCQSLSTITLPAGLKTIKDKAFYTAGLTEITVPDSVTELGVAVFHTNTYLKKAALGSGLTKIPSGTFGYCPALEEVTIPLSIRKIEGECVDEKGEFVCGHAFFKCDSLAKIYYGGSAADWGNIDIEKRAYSNNSITYDNDAITTEKIIYAK